MLFLDQLTKALALKCLEPGASHIVLPFFYLTLVQNEGIAFGLFQGLEGLLLAVISLCIVCLIMVGLRSRPVGSRSHWGMGLILGGALGNWMDRIRGGGVVDFLDFRVWPVFNLADTAITLGVGLFLLEFLKERNHVS